VTETVADEVALPAVGEVSLAAVLSVPVVVGISAVVADVSVPEADEDTGTGVVITEAGAVVEVGSVDAAVESVAEEAGAAVVPLTIEDTVESVGATVEAASVEEVTGADEPTTIVPVDEAVDAGVETTEGVAEARMEVMDGRMPVSVTSPVALEMMLDSTDEIEEMTPVADTAESVGRMLDSTDRIDDSIDGTADGSAVDSIEVPTEARLDSTDEIEDKTDESKTEVGSIVGKAVISERTVVGKRTAVVVVDGRSAVVSVRSKTLELVREDNSDKIDDTGIETMIELGRSVIFGMLAVPVAVTSDAVEAAKSVVTSETTELTMLDASESTEVKIDVGSIVMAMTLELGESEITERMDEIDSGTTVAVVDIALSENVSDGIDTGADVGTGKIEVRMLVRSKLDVSVGNSKTDVAGVLEGATVILAMPVEVLSVTTGTPEDVAIVIAIMLDVGTVTTIDDAGVTSMSEDVNVTGAMLDKTLANEEAADAAEPDMTAVAALLKTDCRLERTETTEAALLSGSTDVRLVKGSTMIADEVVTGRTEVIGRIEVGGRMEMESVSVTETADEVASGEVEAVSKDRSLVVSGNVELITGTSVSVAEAVVGTSDVTSGVDVAKVSSLLEVVVATTELEICDWRDETALAKDESCEAAELALAESAVVVAAGESVVLVTTALEMIEES